MYILITTAITMVGIGIVVIHTSLMSLSNNIIIHNVIIIGELWAYLGLFLLIVKAIIDDSEKH